MTFAERTPESETEDESESDEDYSDDVPMDDINFPTQWPPAPSPLPKPDMVDGHEFEIVKNFFIAYAQDIIKFARISMPYNYTVYTGLPKGFFCKIGRGSKVIQWLFRYFYSQDLFLRINRDTLHLSVAVHMSAVTRKLYLQTHNIGEFDFLPANWKDNTFYHIWDSANSDISALERGRSMLAAARALVAPVLI